MSDPLNLVFGALADPNRRQVIGYLSEQGTATATELTGELPMTRQAVAKHLATLADDVDGTRLTVVETSPAWTTALDLQASAFAYA